MERVVLFLMSEKGYNVLQSIVLNLSTYRIDYIVTARDKNMENDFYKEIKSLAEKEKIKIVDRTSNYKLDSRFAIAISWRWIIKLNNSKTRLIVLHDSLLPRYRGFSPLVNQLLNQEKKIGVTAIFASKFFDRGDIIRQKEMEVSYPVKINDMISKVSVLYQLLVNEILSDIEIGKDIKAYPQKEQDATYSLWRDEDDYQVDWNQSSSYLKQFIYTLGFPFLGAYSSIYGRKIRIIDVEIKEDIKLVIRTNGKVIFLDEDYPVVVCGKGLLRITNAIYDDTKESIFPLYKFRTRFS